MRSATGTLANLELINTEMISRVGIGIFIRIHTGVVRQEFLEECFLGKNPGRFILLLMIHAVYEGLLRGSGGTAAEELAGWDIDIPE